MFRASFKPRLECLEDRRLLAATIMDLGVLPGGTYSRGLAINNAGQVVGYADAADGNPHAFLWDQGVMQDLGVLPGGTSSGAYDINSEGQVVGNSVGPNGTHAFLWDNGVMTDLGTLDGSGGRSSAWAINDAGVIVGASTLPGNPNEPHAVVFDHGNITEIPSQFGGDISYAYDISSSGDVVGYAQTGAGTLHAFLYHDGVMTDIGTLGGDRAKAYRINDLGQIIGSSSEGGRYDKSFIYSDGVMTGLGTLGGAFSYAYDINNASQVVGNSYMSPPNIHAYVWQEGVMTDLNSLLPNGYWTQLTEARGINDLGQVVGYGYHNHQIHAFLMTLDDGSTAAGSVPGLGQVTANAGGGTGKEALTAAAAGPSGASPQEVLNQSADAASGLSSAAPQTALALPVAMPSETNAWSEVVGSDSLGNGWTSL